MIDTAAPIEELLRIPSPAPAPQALACDGARLWMGSRDTRRMYRLDPNTGAVLQEEIAPGIPWAAVATGDDLRVTCGEGDVDDRYIRHYVPGHGFKSSDRLACPEFTGSYLGYDGEWLYLSQFYKGRIMRLDAAGNVGPTHEIGSHIAGFTIVDDAIYVIHGNETACDWKLGKVPVASTTATLVDLAVIPFQARSLGFDGKRFWTNHREANAIVAFANPERF